QDQREMAALLYAGRRSLLNGSAAMRRHRLRPAGPDVVDVLIPWERCRQSTGFVRIYRTKRMPERLFVTGEIRFAKVPRAVADAARSLTPHPPPHPPSLTYATSSARRSSAGPAPSRS